MTGVAVTPDAPVTLMRFAAFEHVRRLSENPLLPYCDGVEARVHLQR